MARPKRSRRPAPRTARVPSTARRRQLLDVAARLLTEQGIDAVQITSVAEETGVSRPLVYRLFPTRNAMLLALLEDFAEALDQQFRNTLLKRLPSSLEAITGAFIDACCDAIEARGAGPWRLLDARGGDPEIASAGRAILARLIQPWHRHIAELTGLSTRRAALLAQAITAAGRAMLEGWIDGHVSRADAQRATTRAVSALLREFSNPW